MDCVSQNNCSSHRHLSFGRVIMSISYSFNNQPKDYDWRCWWVFCVLSFFLLPLFSFSASGDKTTRNWLLQHRHPIGPTSLFGRNTAFVTPLIHQQVQHRLPWRDQCWYIEQCWPYLYRPPYAQHHHHQQQHLHYLITVVVVWQLLIPSFSSSNADGTPTKTTAKLKRHIVVDSFCYRQFTEKSNSNNSSDGYAGVVFTNPISDRRGVQIRHLCLSTHNRAVSDRSCRRLLRLGISNTATQRYCSFMAYAWFSIFHSEFFRQWEETAPWG